MSGTVGVMDTDTNANRAPWADSNGVLMGNNQATAWISRTI